MFNKCQDKLIAEQQDVIMQRHLKELCYYY